MFGTITKTLTIILRAILLKLNLRLYTKTTLTIIIQNFWLLLLDCLYLLVA